MRELLETWGLEANFLPSPLGALEALRADPARCDLVITDQAMPRLSGLQLAGAVHALRPELPVILYTGYGEGLDAAALKAAGIDTVLAKPVDPQALESALRKLLGDDPPSRGAGTGDSVA
jgi:CheY-like chemotaxis protein